MRLLRKKTSLQEALQRLYDSLSEIFYRFKIRIALSLLFSIILSVSFPIIYVMFLLTYLLIKTSTPDQPLISQLSLYALSPGMYILEVKSDYKGIYNIFTFIPLLNLVINLVVFFILMMSLLSLSAYIFNKDNVREVMRRMIDFRRKGFLNDLAKKLLREF